MSRLLVIGCGGVASVAIRKCCQNSDVFTEIMIASRTKEKCDALKEKIESTTKTKIETAKVDADNVAEVAELIRAYKPDAVLNVALPYQDLTIMDACLEAGADYIDTANYEAEDTEDPTWRAIYEKRCKEKGFTAYFDYSWQWAYDEKFKKAGLTALLGTGFDPGVTSVFSAYALKHYFDEIHTIDILDCNGGDHGYPFATNFNPEINLREVSANGSYWEDGHWVETEPMEFKSVYDFPEVGKKDMYLLHHEEIESLAKNIPGVQRIRFFMTFGQSYLTHMKCLENVGMLSTAPVEFNGQDEMEEQVSLYVDDMKEEEIVEPKDETYIEEKYKKIVEKLPEIDELLEKYSKGWKLSRMNKVDLTILRLGVYEMKYDEDIPERVAINEAVELAKKFGGDESPAFVNAVLAKLSSKEA